VKAEVADVRSEVAGVKAEVADVRSEQTRQAGVLDRILAAVAPE
jgi:hypothetical protein